MSDGKIKGEKAKRSNAENHHHKDLSDILANKLDTRVTIELGKSKGKITIEFADEEDLQRITQILR